MSTQGNAPVVQPVEPVVQPDQQSSQEPVKDTVQLETHRKLLDEKKKLQARLDAFEADKRAQEEADARKRGDLELILKNRDAELEAEKQKRTAIESRLEVGFKMNAVIDALGGNLDAKWHRLIDVSKVPINPETGEVDAASVAKLAQELKREWPEMVKTNSSLPANAPRGFDNGSGAISRKEWLALPYAKMRQYKPSQIID